MVIDEEIKNPAFRGIFSGEPQVASVEIRCAANAAQHSASILHLWLTTNHQDKLLFI